MRILIVEDETKTGDYLRKGLLEAGFLADLARTGPDGLNLASMAGAYCASCANVSRRRC